MPSVEYLVKGFRNEFLYFYKIPNYDYRVSQKKFCSFSFTLPPAAEREGAGKRKLRLTSASLHGEVLASPLRNIQRKTYLCKFPGGACLFSDAKFTEDPIQQIFGGGLAG